jgi:hypothetical protein
MTSVHRRADGVGDGQPSVRSNPAVVRLNRRRRCWGKHLRQ